MINIPQDTFFDVMIKNSDEGYHELVRLMDKHLTKDILNDTMFELFLAIRKNAIPNSIIEIKAADNDDHYILWSKFEMDTQDLIKLDIEISEANKMINFSKEDIIQNRLQEYRKETPRILDGFKMVMAYSHAVINYDADISKKTTLISIRMNLQKKN